MCQALADRSGNIVQETEETRDIVWVEFDGGDHAEVGMGNPIICEEL